MVGAVRGRRRTVGVKLHFICVRFLIDCGAVVGLSKLSNGSEYTFKKL